jgi:predicted dehydrogenase
MGIYRSLMNATRVSSVRGCGRREFLKVGAAGVLGMGLGNLAFDHPAIAEEPQGSLASPALRPLESVRIGFVGVGDMGSCHVQNLLKIEKAEIRAVCDIVEGKVARAQEMVVQAGGRKPEGYSRGDTDFKRLCERDDIDLVYNATPWQWHVPICLAAMNSGKHAATEVPAAVTLDECWQLVETAEKTGRHCVMMENCCYDRTELMILNMVRNGLLGELTRGEGGYLHDLRAIKFSRPGEGPWTGEGVWRLPHSERRNGDLYPTHGLGPVAQCMNVNRGNRLVRLTSMGSQTRGLALFAAKKYGPESPQAKQHYALSDVVVTLIQTHDGQVIVLNHDTSSPRPYSRNILVQGTKGIVVKYPEEKIHIDGRSKENEWEPLENYRKEFEHPLWKALAKRAEGMSQGGMECMDFIEDYRLIQCLLSGTPTDLDVYDAAAFSAVSALSERSIAAKSAAVEFPDFTRGKWKKRLPLGIIS